MWICDERLCDKSVSTILEGGKTGGNLIKFYLHTLLRFAHEESCLPCAGLVLKRGIWSNLKHNYGKNYQINRCRCTKV